MKENAHGERKKEKAAAQKRLRDLDKVTAKIEVLERDLASLNEAMSEPEFFQLSLEEQARSSDEARQMEASLLELMEAWEALEE